MAVKTSKDWEKALEGTRKHSHIFSLEWSFSLCIFFNLNKNYQVSRCTKHYTEENEMIGELNSKLLQGDFIPN